MSNHSIPTLYYSCLAVQSDLEPYLLDCGTACTPQEAMENARLQDWMLTPKDSSELVRYVPVAVSYLVHLAEQCPSCGATGEQGYRSVLLHLGVI
jgi:hypothetical protein